MITQHKCRHRFYHRNSPGQYARIVSSARGEFGGFAGYGDGLLRPKNRRSRFESHPKKDILTVADPTLNPSRKIRPGPHFAVSHFEDVVVFSAGELTPGKA